jgi:hypothetical protein
MLIGNYENLQLPLLRTFEERSKSINTNLIIHNE